MPKIAILCFDKIGKSMAGPAIRCWEIAKELSKSYEVKVMTIYPSERNGEGFEITHIKSNDFSNNIANFDLVISQPAGLRANYQILKTGVRWIVDAYDPIPLEHLEMFKDHLTQVRQKDIEQSVLTVNMALKYAQGIICASERQKNLWIGNMMGLGKLSYQFYEKDPNLQKHFEIVPFGLPDQPPVHKGLGPREKFNLNQDDKIVLWGGGIWNWFDPLSVIRGFDILSRKREDIKLIFMGTQHPNKDIPKMRMTHLAVKLAKEKNLMDKLIFFNWGWTTYEDRQAFLCEADVGISTHFNNLETRFAFRTRILDYLWAGLPIIATEGDYFADLILQKKIGRAVPYESPLAIAEAIEEIVDNQDKSAIKKNIASTADCFTWKTVVKPLAKLIENAMEQTVSRPSILQKFNLQKEIIKGKGMLDIIAWFYKKIKF